MRPTRHYQPLKDEHARQAAHNQAAQEPQPTRPTTIRTPSVQYPESGGLVPQEAAASADFKNRQAVALKNAEKLSGKANLAAKLQAAKDGATPPPREREAAHAPAAPAPQPQNGRERLAAALSKAKQNVTVPQPTRDQSRGR